MKEKYVFDMGHVIIKPSNLKEMYKYLNTKRSYQEFKNYFYNSKSSFDGYKGLLSDYEFLLRLKKYLNITKNPNNLRNIYLQHKGGVYKETIDIIKRIKNKGNKVYLLSNLKEMDYEYLSQVMDLNLFDKKYLSYELGTAKPEIKIFKEVISDLGTNDFYFFDDSKENIKVASSLGIKAYQTTGESIEKTYQKTRYINN